MINIAKKTILSKSKYTTWIKDELSITKTKVKKWLVWDDLESRIYEAYFDTRSVVIPIPVCGWSFLVALHEIGHISTGDRNTNYLREYNAERWAIKRAKKYNISSTGYVKEAKEYVKSHIIHDIIHCNLKVEKIKPYVLKWLNTTYKNISKEIEVAKLK